MRKFLFSIIVFSTALCFAACSGGSGPDANAVQVGNGDIGSLPIADIPSDFTSAADALSAGNRLFDAGETERAIDAYLQAVKMDPDLAEAYFKLGIAYALVESEIDSANAAAVDSTPEPTSKKAQEKKKNSEKAFESAAAAYKKILAKNPEDDVAHFHLGLTYNKLNEDEDAAKSLREAVKLKPDNAEYQTELGVIYIKLAKYYEAVTALKKALELDPENAKAEDMLERAEAGKKRIEFVPPRKEDDKTGNSNTNSNANAAVNTKPSGVSNSNLGAKPPIKPAKTPSPVRTPR
jgi:tetratricopeptide (TPR) repeat protein